MKTFRILVLSAAGLAFVLFSAPAMAGETNRDDNMLVDYPDGRYGIDMGGGFVTMPDGEVLPPSGYRRELERTEYGPMTPTGFTVFPGSEFEKHEKADLKKDQRKTNDYMFYEKGTTARGSLWGFSSPRPKQEDQSK